MWWPAANGEPWTWTWATYPGVWLFAAALAAAYAVPVRVWGRRLAPPGDRPITRRQTLSLAAGLLLLLAATSWPVGLLGAGYLLTVHSVQHLAIAVVAAPLLLLGTPAWLAQAALRPRGVHLAVRGVTHPLVAIVVFNAVFVLSHLPAVVDTVHPTQAGTFATTTAFLVAGLLVWWPIVGPVPINRLPQLLVLPYLFLQFVLPKLPAGILIFSEQPMFDLYRDADRVWAGFSASTDQQVAGAIIWLVGGTIIVLAIGGVLVHWQREERMRDVRRELGLPASAEALAVLFEAPGAWDALQRLTSTVRRVLDATPVRADLAYIFAEDDPASDGGHPLPRLTLEVRADVGPMEQLALWERIDREYGAYVRSLKPRRQEAVRRCLGFRVAAYTTATP